MTERLKVKFLAWLQRIFCVLLLCCAAYGQTPKVIEAKPLRTVTLSTEQNELLLNVQKQMKELDEQFNRLKLGLQMRQQAIVDTISATNKLGAAEVKEVRPGEFELRETPPKVETKEVKDKP